MRDLRKYAQQTTTRLIFLGILVLLVVGDGLIYLIYGPSAAITGVLCIIGGMTPVVLIILSLTLMDWIVKRANKE
jgi:hypothetical protein